MVHTDLSNDFEFSEYRLNESPTLFGDVLDVLSVVSPFVVRLGCNSFYGICAKCYFVEIGVGKAELCYGRKWSYYCCVSHETVWPFQNEYATFNISLLYVRPVYSLSPRLSYSHIILYCRCFCCVASRCFCRRLRNIKKRTWCRRCPPDLPTVSVCDLVQGRKFCQIFMKFGVVDFYLP